MTIKTKTIGRLPVNLGEFDSTRAYGKKNRVLQYGCELESKVENNTYPPYTWDGANTFNLDSVHWVLISGSPEVWAAAQPKPATTGTTGDYPYNGMGRVVLKKNMVNGVNTLTQDMFYKGEVGSRVPNTDTIYVIQYDFTLGENITIPADCILEFDGGSISAGSGQNMDIITGQNTGINAGLVKIFNTNVTFAGSWNIAEAYPEWFGGIGDGILGTGGTDNTVFFQKILTSFHILTLCKNRKYYVDSTIYVDGDDYINGNYSTILIKDTLDYLFILNNGASYTTFSNKPIENLRICRKSDTPPTVQNYAFKLQYITVKPFNNIILEPYGIGFAYIGTNVWDIRFNNCVLRGYTNDFNCVTLTHITNIGIKFNNCSIEGYSVIINDEETTYSKDIYFNNLSIGGTPKTIFKSSNTHNLVIFCNNSHIEPDNFAGILFNKVTCYISGGDIFLSNNTESAYDYANDSVIKFERVQFHGGRYLRSWGTSTLITTKDCTHDLGAFPPTYDRPYPLNSSLKASISDGDIKIGWVYGGTVHADPTINDNVLTIPGYDNGVYFDILNPKSDHLILEFKVKSSGSTTHLGIYSKSLLGNNITDTDVFSNGDAIPDITSDYKTVRACVVTEKPKRVFMSTSAGFDNISIKDIKCYPGYRNFGYITYDN